MSNNNFRKIKRVYWGLCILCVIVFMSIVELKNRDANKKFYKSKYRGIVMEIDSINNERGLNWIKINGNWHHFGYWERDIQSNIKVGDSIVKNQNTYLIKIFRINSYNEWQEIYFE